MNRLCIFAMHAPNGHADGYIYFLLETLKNISQDLCVVCNGKIDEYTFEKLSEYTKYVFVREDKGYDAAAFKSALEQYMGWDKVNQYDELLIANDSCYGPFYPLEEVFSEMDSRNADFWALTAQSQSKLYPFHLQPYFAVFKSRLLHHKVFREFWSALEIKEGFMETVEAYELHMTRFFVDNGFTCDSYIHPTDFENPNCESHVFIMMEPFRLLSEKKCPFIKKKIFLHSQRIVLMYHLGQDARRVLDYIANETDYDVNLIWENLLHIADINQLQTSLHMTYSFPSVPMGKESVISNKRVGVIAHINYPELIDKCLGYVTKLPEGVDLMITTKGERNVAAITEKLKQYGRSNYRIVVPKDRGREIAGLLIACKEYLFQYDYLCFVHDKRSNEGMPYATIGQSYMDILWENTLSSVGYIENVLKCFEDNPRLGFLSPPPIYVNTLIALIGTWNVEYNSVCELIKRLQLHTAASPDYPPFALGTTFWCRPKALKALFAYPFQYEDFQPEPMAVYGTISHAIERIFAYVAQHEGYYSGIAMTEEYSSMYITNLIYILNAIMSKQLMPRNIWSIEDVYDRDRDIDLFCRRFQDVYIYGAGIWGRRVLNVIHRTHNDIVGFIVSDDRYSDDTYLDKKIYKLSDIPVSENCGIIVALGPKNKKEVMPKLQQLGYENIFEI